MPSLLIRHSEAPSIVMCEPGRTSPKKGPSVVPAKVQKNDARGAFDAKTRQNVLYPLELLFVYDDGRFYH